MVGVRLTPSLLPAAAWRLRRCSTSKRAWISTAPRGRLALSAACWPAPCLQYGVQHPRPFLLRPWREAIGPRVALPSRPWHVLRHQVACTCGWAPQAALLQLLPARLLRGLRSATWKTVVAPVARAPVQ